MVSVNDERLTQLRQLDRALDLLDECADVLRSLDGFGTASLEDELRDSLRRFVRDALAEQQEDGGT